jgi:tryptophanyl-tRNA synthetase
LNSGPESKRKRVLSGMRPTGRLHIGHYFGALANWVALQNDPAYDCFYFVADWHALTSDYADTSGVAQNTIEIGIDYLASGLDPERATLFVQSQVPEHAELNLLLGMITPLGWLERVPTYKEAIENIQGKDLHTFGFLGYPVLQTADIVIYGEPDRALVVPVGEDQVAHVELSREIVRRFDTNFGFQVKDALFLVENLGALQRVMDFATFKPGEYDDYKPAFRSSIRKFASEIGLSNFFEKIGDAREFFSFKTVLREPEVMLTPTPRIPGTDGRKMSKSYGNAVMLSESDENIWEKVRPMKTDPQRKRRTDPGDPDVCPVYDWHKLFSPPETLAWSAEGCRTARIGCIECKRAMADNLIKWIAPVRARRQEYEADPARVLEILDAGSKRARKTAQQTMERVREAIFGWQAKRSELSQPASAGKPGAGD